MTDNENIKSNIPEYSVSDLAISLKKTLEDGYGRVRVRGELSRVSVAGSGHMYSSLKDENAVIDAVCWRGTMNKLSVRPEEGLEVICTGRISTYPQRSNYQLIIESMELAGEGALLKMLEERRKRLAAEGLFAEERKRPLPFLPDVIGVVTSPTGAVIRDILHRLDDRFPRHVLVWPVLVQGDGAADQITAAINGFQTIHEHGLPRPDLLIIARGGGSLEDLMAFNEENVVRAAANSSIPLISAVGHETDTTLIDFVADRRAPTPTGAAEIAVPTRLDLHARLTENAQRMTGALQRFAAERRQRLQGTAARLGDPARMLEAHNQKLDHLSDKKQRVFAAFLAAKSQRLSVAHAGIRSPQERLRQSRERFSRWREGLQAASGRILKDPQQRLQTAGKMLQAYSFENILERGFTVIRDENGSLITDPAQATDNAAITVQFHRNKMLQAVVTRNKNKKKSKNPAKAPSKTSDDQQSLF